MGTAVGMKRKIAVKRGLPPDHKSKVASLMLLFDNDKA